MAEFYPDGIVHEEHYAQTMNQTVVPALKEIRRDRMVPGKDGNELFVSVFPAEDPKGTVIIHHGFTENVEKFSEVIFALHKAGYTVGMHDARGHGRSYREPGVDSASGDTHIGRFDDYVEDLETLMKTAYKDLPYPRYLLCHSMGGAVGALYLEKHPEDFKCAVLSSPMIAPYTNGVPTPAALAICSMMTNVGRGKHRIMMSPGYTGHENFATSCASSKARFDWFDEMKFDEKLFHNSSPTYQWTVESIHVTNRILKPGEVEKIRIPVLVMQASEDHSVLNGPMDRFVQRLPKGRKERFEGTRHEIFRGTDKDVCHWMDEILTFYAS